jgi:outer membrane receptor protein involved in Fe transport
LLNTPLKTGSFLDLDLRQSPVSLTIITKDQIDASGARTLSELLEIYVPGFQYMINKWDGTLWGMRGVATDRNTKFIFAVNGIKENAESRDGACMETDLGLLGDIERVEVLRGPAGLVYGSGAIAGVVNLVTRTPDRPMIEGKVGVGTGTQLQAEALGNTTFASDDNFTISFGLRGGDGLGEFASRIYGSSSFPLVGPSKDGLPTQGSAWSTPGDGRLSIDYHNGNFRLYARATLEQIPAGPAFVADPWPEYNTNPPANAPPRTIDGTTYLPSGPLGTSYSNDASRQLYTYENISVTASYKRDFGLDSLEGRLSWIGFTDRVSLEYQPGFALPGSKATEAGVIQQTMGERRYVGNVQYLLKRITNLQSATGVELGIYQIGSDLQGLDQFGASQDHLDVAQVSYVNFAAYTENYYTLNNKVAFDLGLRMDKHTLTDVQLNPKAAVIFTPSENHSIKLFAQTSSNNGSADNYEYDYNYYNDLGQVSSVAHLQDPTNPNSQQIPGVTLAQLHSLQPERALSVEAASTHRVGGLTILPSFSFNRIFNLFVWNQELFRVINAQPYNFIAAELEVKYENSKVQVGASHVYQRVVDSNNKPLTFTIPQTQVVSSGNGTYSLQPIPGPGQQIVVNTIGDQVTQDGRNFLNLATNSTKVYVDVHPISRLTLDTSARIFWGLPGRADLYKTGEAQGYNYLSAENSPIIKWGIGALLDLPYDTRVGLHAYDLLGSANSLAAVRWQQMANNAQGELYTLDQRSVIATFEIKH